MEAGDAFWPLAPRPRELEDLVLHLRHNEPEIGTLVFASEGALEAVAAHDAFLLAHRGHWLVREILLYWKRLLKRIVLTSRSLVALVEPGSCFAGFLLELVLAADRAYMLDGPFGDGDDSGDDGDGTGTVIAAEETAMAGTACWRRCASPSRTSAASPVSTPRPARIALPRRRSGVEPRAAADRP